MHIHWQTFNELCNWRQESWLPKSIQRHCYSNILGKGIIKTAQPSLGVKVCSHALKVEHNLWIHQRYETGFFFCVFRLSGYSEGRWGEKEIPLQGGVSAFGYFIGDEVKFFPKRDSCREIIFLLDREVVIRWLGEKHPALERVDGQPLDSWSLFWKRSIMPVERMILERIDVLLEEESKGGLELEFKVLELFYNYFSMGVDLPDSLSNRHQASVHRAKEILLSNIASPLSIKEIAYKAAVNECDLKKEFKKHFGTTMHTMLQEYRLDIAKELLVRGDLSVAEVAKRVGYSSLSHFGKIFHERFGLLPRELKRG